MTHPEQFDRKGKRISPPPPPPPANAPEWPPLTTRHFRPIRRLGSGGFGSVVLAQYLPTKAYVAVKMTLTTRASSSKAKAARRERAVLEMMQGRRNMLQMKAAFSDAEGLYIVTELHPKGTLASEVELFGCLNRERALHRFAEIVSRRLLSSALSLIDLVSDLLDRNMS
jgi:serine/threonine protein kinase